METKIARGRRAIKDRFRRWITGLWEQEQSQEDNHKDDPESFGQERPGGLSEGKAEGDGTSYTENGEYHGSSGLSGSGSKIRINSESRAAASCFSSMGVSGSSRELIRRRASCRFIVYLLPLLAES